jgi:hypothetical protein
VTIPQGKQAKRKQAASISAHRLFPVVPVWFAALLGLTSFVVPPRMLASLVVASGLPKVLPAAAPPLGFTARVLVAFALAVVGGLIGLVSPRAAPGQGGQARRRRCPIATTRWNPERPPWRIPTCRAARATRTPMPRRAGRWC